MRESVVIRILKQLLRFRAILRTSTYSGWKFDVQNYRHSFNVGSNWGHVFVQ
jgi:hypothetical protein